SMARRLGPRRIALLMQAEVGLSSQWTATTSALGGSVATRGFEEHDIAMELLGCLGQAIWEKLSGPGGGAYWTILGDRVKSGIEGEIDEQALAEKRSLLESPRGADSASHLESYGRSSFAGTAAEYVHCLWHVVSIRSGADYLPAEALRRRLELLARWLPP